MGLMKRWLPAFFILAASPFAKAAITIDGKISEPEWQTATEIRDLVTVTPYSREAPDHLTEIRYFADEAGIWVAVRNYQPATSHRSQIHAKDGASLADSNTLILDFDARTLNAYHFQLSLGGSRRDGIWSNQHHLNLDWDGKWYGATAEEADAWTSEFFIPWSVAPMVASESEQRTLNMYVGRHARALGKDFAWPAASPTRQTFIGEFSSVSIPNFQWQPELDLIPYISANFDNVGAEDSWKAGLDIFWQPTRASKLSATLNPDFGQVESDDLVVNFTAIETFFSEKRPFFLENQSLFDVRGNENLRLMHTRRIGGSPDLGDDESTDLDGALKFTQSLGNFEYGVFGAFEDDADDSEGRNYGVARGVWSTDSWKLGYLYTHVDHGATDRTANVHTLDYEVDVTGDLKLTGGLTASVIDDVTNAEDGLGAWVVAQYSPVDNWNNQLFLTHYDEDLQLDDLGFLRRNNLNKIGLISNYTLTDFAQDQTTLSRKFTVNFESEHNNTGDKLTDRYELGWAEEFKSTASMSIDLVYRSSGIDDLISRGAGNVELPERKSVTVYYALPKGEFYWQDFLVQRFEEGLDGYATYASSEINLFVSDQITLIPYISYIDSDDWIIWIGGDQLATFSRRLWDLQLNADIGFADRHTLRVKFQWLGLQADARQGFVTSPSGALQPVSEPVDDFELADLGIQLRYRYSIGPLSDFFIVYSRGGSVYDETDQDSFPGLYQQSFDDKTAENLFFKLRYRF